MLKLKKIEAGSYITTDGKYIIEKDSGYWYGVDAKTGNSVVDSERTKAEIVEKIEAMYTR